MKGLKELIQEKLKISKNLNLKHEYDELFETVTEKLYEYNGLLDIKTLKIPYTDIYYTCYMEGPNNRKDGITFVNKRGSNASVYSFKELCDTLFYKEDDIYTKEILEKILELIEENE